MYTCMSERLEVQHYDAFSVEHKIMQFLNSSFHTISAHQHCHIQLDLINGWPYLSVAIGFPGLTFQAKLYSRE